MRFLPLLAVLVAGSAAHVAAQALVPPEYAEPVNDAYDRGPAKGELACRTQVFSPFLDFALRFEAGFVVNCQLAQFEGQGQELAAYLRVTPEGGAHTLLGERIGLPTAPTAAVQRIQWQNFHGEFEYSGAVGLGPGRYRLELLLSDRNGRSYRKRWSAKAELRGKEKGVKLTAAPAAVVPLAVPPWHQLREANAPDKTLTVLLNAAPLYPFSQKLRAWDRAFLLGSLASLLGQTSAGHVRVIAFNLDQQKQVFRDDHFDRKHFDELAEALRTLELGTVKYQTLQRENGWADLLVGLLNEEWSSRDPSNAVVFLGPNSRFLDKIEPAFLRKRADIGPRLFYFEYFSRVGYEFPDAIHQMTNACRGTVFKLHSPAEFALSIGKLERRLDGSDTATP